MKINLFKTNLLWLVLCSSFTNISATEKPTQKKNPEYQKNYTTLNLRGKVKSIKCTDYQQFIPYSELTYYVSKEDYRFDQQGNVIEEIIYWDDQTVHYRRVFSYDIAGNYVKFDSYSKNNLIEFRGKNTFNLQGRRIAYQESTIDNQVKYKETYDFIELSDRKAIYNSHQLIPLGKDTFQYIECFHKGNLISQMRILHKEIFGRYTYKYDSLNNRTEELEYSSGDTVNWITKTLFKYDSERRLIYRERNSRLYNYQYITETKYDSFGNILIEKVTENGAMLDKRSYRNEYIYDNQNNWVKRTTYKLNDELKFTLERNIEYF